MFLICFETTINITTFFFWSLRALSLCVCKLSCTWHTAEKLLDVTPRLKKLCVLHAALKFFRQRSCLVYDNHVVYFKKID